MKNFKEKVVQFIRDEEGLELVEYAVSGGLIVVGVVVAFGLLGDEVNRIITIIKDELVGVTK